MARDNWKNVVDVFGQDTRVRKVRKLCPAAENLHPKQLRLRVRGICSFLLVLAFSGGLLVAPGCPKNVPKPQAPEASDSKVSQETQLSPPPQTAEDDRFRGLETFFLEDFADVPLGKRPESWSMGTQDMVKLVGGKKRLEPASRGFHTFYIPLPDLPERFVFILEFAYIEGGVTLQLGNLILKRRRFYDELQLNDQRGVLKTGVLMKPFTWVIEKQGDLFIAELNGQKIVSAEIPNFSSGPELILDFGQEDYSLSSIRVLGSGEIMAGPEMDFSQPTDSEGDDNSENEVMDFTGNE